MPTQRLADKYAKVSIVDGIDDMRQHAYDAARNGIGICRLRQPISGEARRINRPKLCPENIRRKKITLDEDRQPFPDAILAPGQDRRVGYWQSERLTEERRHCEPIGEPADEGGLGGCSNEQYPEPRLRCPGRRDGQRRHRPEQRGRDQAISPKPASLKILRAYRHADRTRSTKVL